MSKDVNVISTNEASEKRKPLNWQNRFDLVLSKKKCPPGGNIPKKYKDDFIFVERKIVDVNSINIVMFDNVRKEILDNDIIKQLETSFEQHQYLHDQYPPIIIEKIIMRAGEKHYSYGVISGNNRLNAIKNLQGWPKMMVDIYRCENDRALLSLACIANHHRAPFKTLSTADYVKAGVVAAWGSDAAVSESIGGFLGQNVKRPDIKDYIEEIVGDMLSKKVKETIVTTVWNYRNIKITGERIQPFCLSKLARKSINSAELYARGGNPFAPNIKLPYGGDTHLSDEDNVIEELGYIAGNKTTGIKDKIGLAIRKYNEYEGKRKVLFYLFIESGKRTLTEAIIDKQRKEAVQKFNDEIDQYCEFFSLLKATEKDVVKKEINNIFKLVGFLSQKISKEYGVQKESTIVDVHGNPVHELTGELLER